MKLSHGFGLIAAALGSVGLTVVAGSSAGCSSSSGSNSSSSGGASDLCANLPASDCLPPPTKPTMGSAPKSGSHNYALHKLYLGDTDRTGTPSADAWKAFGYNLDGKVTSATSTDVCTLVAGAPKQNQVDGTGGADNSFGANIMAIVDAVDSTASMTLNSDIQAGAFTIMTYVTGFDDSAGNTTTATDLTGVLLAGGKYTTADGGAGTPTWDMTTVWPVLPDPSLISGCSATTGCPMGTDPVKSALIKFTDAFQTKGTFVNGTPSPLTLTLSIGGQQLSLDIASAVISFDPQMPGAVTNGIIAGVLGTENLVNGLRSVAGNISTSLCGGSAFNSIAMQIEQASDILLASDGKTVSNSPGTTCNAISIGLGFDSTEIAAPSTIAAPSAPIGSKCADAGTD